MRATDIVGYTFNADQFHPECLRLPTGKGEAFDGWALADGVWMPVEQNLDEIAAAFGINRQDESTFDSGDFPKVIFASQVEDDDDVCGRCGAPLLERPNLDALNDPRTKCCGRDAADCDCPSDADVLREVGMDEAADDLDEHLGGTF